MILNGRVGQVLGPFDTSDLLEENGAISQITPETSKPILEKLGVQAAKGTMLRINGMDIKIGATGIYELDYVVAVTSLSFPNGADENTIVDFVY